MKESMFVSLKRVFRNSMLFRNVGATAQQHSHAGSLTPANIPCRSQLVVGLSVTAEFSYKVRFGNYSRFR